jgi:hypothetical protein
MLASETMRKSIATPMFMHQTKVASHLSPIKEASLRYMEDVPGHNEPWYIDCYGMSHWLVTTWLKHRPTSTLLSRGLGHATPDHKAAAPRPSERLKLLEHLLWEHERNHKAGKSDQGKVIRINGNLVSSSCNGQTMSRPTHTTPT